MAPPKSGVQPCSKCRYPTRTSRATLSEYPGTRKRVRDMCRPCAEREQPSPYQVKAKIVAGPSQRQLRAEAQIVADPPDPATMSSLNAFVAARNARLARWKRVNL